MIVDYRHLTAPCGLPCFECYLFKARASLEYRKMVSDYLGLPLELAQCRGCREEGGKCAHLPMACRVHPCVEAKGLHNCSECDDFPCDLLHPYQDRAEIWHNTKVYQLCLIRKMGLEKWAVDKAGQVAQTYFFEPWSL